MRTGIGRALGTGLVMGLLVGVVPACGGGNNTACNASTCATGCCDADGECQQGTLQSACGSAAGVCQVCAANQFCQAGVCVGTSNNNNDGGNNNTTDGGNQTDGGNTTDGGTTGPTVTVTRRNRYLTPSGETSAPITLAMRSLKAFTISGNTLVEAPVTEVGDGGFTFAIPEGATYYVMDGRSALVTTARDVDLGRWIQGRSEPIPPVQTVQSATVNASNLVPWSANDSFQLGSEHVWEMAYLNPNTPPANGATSVTNLACNYVSLMNGSMEASKGDVALLHQVRGADVGDAGITESYIVASGSAGPVTIDGTGAPTLTATLSPVQVKTVNADLRGAEFAALSTQVNPAAIPASAAMSIIGVPQGLSRGYLGYMAELNSTFAPPDVGDTTVTLHYGNPKSTWGELGDVSWYYASPAQLPGTTGGSVGVYAGRTGTVTQIFGSPLRPVMTPPRNLLVAGNDGWTAATLTSLTPVISWNAPAQGAPTAYAVRVRELTVSSTNRTRSVGVGSVVTQGTSVVIPPGILQSGKSYVFIVEASSRSGGQYDAARAPFYDYLSSDHAQVASAQFLAP